MVILSVGMEAPPDMKDSVTQAGAAAARILGLMALVKVKIPAITSVIDPDACNSCGVCAKACPYGAITVDKKAKTPAVVAEAACAGCGTCGAECIQGAIVMKHARAESGVQPHADGPSPSPRIGYLVAVPHLGASPLLPTPGPGNAGALPAAQSKETGSNTEDTFISVSVRGHLSFSFASSLRTRSSHSSRVNWSRKS